MNDCKPSLLGDQLNLPNVPLLLSKHLKKTKRQCGPWCMLGKLLNGGALFFTETCMERLIQRPKALPEESDVIPYSLGLTLISIRTTSA